MNTEDRHILPLLLLYKKENSEIYTLTKFQKLVFLLQDDEYNFEAADYGPFSEELAHSLDVLDNKNLLYSTTETNRAGYESITYTLTEQGSWLVESFLEKEDSEYLENEAENIIDEYDVPVQPLLRRMRKEYEDYFNGSYIDI